MWILTKPQRPLQNHIHVKRIRFYREYHEFMYFEMINFND